MLLLVSPSLIFFFFNDTATTEIYTLSLHDALPIAQLAERQYSRTVVLHAQRGPILDRQGTPLATSTPTESLFVQPRSVGDPVRVTARLPPIIGLPPAEVHAVLTSSRSFVWSRRRR